LHVNVRHITRLRRKDTLDTRQAGPAVGERAVDIKYFLWIGALTIGIVVTSALMCTLKHATLERELIKLTAAWLVTYHFGIGDC